MSVESDGASYKTRVTCFFYVSKAPINVLKTQAVATILLKASGGVLGYEVFEGYVSRGIIDNMHYTRALSVIHGGRGHVE